MSEGTKLVRVTLAGLVRMEYVETLRVPANISDDELATLASKRYRDVDAGEFVQDPHYWEQGECHAVVEEAKPAVKVTGKLVRQADGELMYVEEAEPEAVDNQQAISLAAIEDNAAQSRVPGRRKFNPYGPPGDPLQFNAYEAGWYRGFEAWCEEVERLETSRCAAINATPGQLFKAAHEPYPKEMLRMYFDEGHTPTDAHEMIVGNTDCGRSEALAS
ncbi:hypothetical protein [Ottowia sp.]|uniref:hypothetical protein n=1 Tax=Ottowia sp. TaxID=1898956 RepID=UPI0025DC78EE|nr:hypothetical protein [Ottowia sp.]MBK6616545.1 hypothetical protein [Ottowia sp.]